MIRHILTFTLSLAIATPALAFDARCTPSSKQRIEAFEQAKDALFRGEFDRFDRIVNPFSGPRDQAVTDDLRRLSNSFPNGFRECAVVVQRRELPGFFQEVILFDTGGAPLGLYLQGAVLRGDSFVTDFSLSADLGAIIGRLE
ncbi:MAG: hypothetical protein AAF771_15420 [Pseudomonadota bacterium]